MNDFIMGAVYNKKVHNNIPDDAVYIGRGSKWGNDWSHLNYGKALHQGLPSAAEAVFRYEDWVLNGVDFRAMAVRAKLLRGDLAGKSVVCFCVNKDHEGYCHGNFLMGFTEDLATTGDREAVLAQWRNLVNNKINDLYGPRVCDEHCPHDFN